MKDNPTLKVLDPLIIKDKNIVVHNLTVGKYFETETRQIARFLGCNEDELVSEMNKLFERCVKLITH